MGRIDHLALVAIGGAAGAVIRWALADAWTVDSFPWPTLIVNVVGCALLGVFTADGMPVRAQRLLATGFCGGLTTFSTLSVEVVRLLDAGSAVVAAIYVAASVILGLAAFVSARTARPPSAPTVEGAP